jgi:CubicO group peptidase (beta-lactamase class C family)
VFASPSSLRARRAVPLLLAAALAAPSVLAGQSAPPAALGEVADARFESVRESVRLLVESGDLPSLVVAVARDGQLLWSQGAGWADLDRRIPATISTPYSIASISKPMTAVAIMRLAAAGHLDLDRPANDYLGEARITSGVWDASGATVRRLLNHTAGLPLHYSFFYEGSGDPGRSTDEGISRYGVLVNPPGEAYEYSNLGYGILGRIVERISGRPYADFMREEVFAPLGMKGSSVGTGADLPGVAVRYDSHREPIAAYDFDHRGGSAVFASVEDLIRFGTAQLRRGAGIALLPDSVMDAMQTSSGGGLTEGYALGWSVVPDDGGYRRVSHTGGMPGVTTALYLYPEAGVVVAAVTNTRDRSVLTIAEKAAAAVLPGYGETLRTRR